MASELGMHYTGLNGSAFTAAQLEEYFARISLPQHYRDQDRQPSSSPTSNNRSSRSDVGSTGRFRKLPPTLDTLSLLQKYQLAAVPFENLSLHYCATATGDISLDAHALFNKLVRAKRGGYCMENNLFFMHILRALGFDVYCAGSRARRRLMGVPRGGYLGWCHAVIIVTLLPLSHGSGNGERQTRYMVDVGFGGDGPIHPLPLVHAQVTPNIGAQELRLVHEPLPEFANQAQKMWIYQYRNAPCDDWKPLYLFTDQEFLQQDFEIMSFYTSRASTSYVTYSITVVRMLLDEEEREPAHSAAGHEQDGEGGKEKAPAPPRIYGKIMIAGSSVKKNTGGKTETLQECETEQQRVKALKDWFGIELSQIQIDGIYGRCSSLPREELLDD